MKRQAADCLLLLGGNLGDRRARLREALGKIARLPGTTLLRVSRVYETAPVGPSRERYLNAAAAIRTTLSPMGLLVECKRLEAEAGRKPGKRWGARPLDVDVVSYGARKLRTRWLTVPHPRMAGRAFALAPLNDVAASWRPDGRRTVAALLRRLKPDEQTVKIATNGL